MMEISTAIVIFAPFEVQAVAVPMLKQYFPEALRRAPAHITILYPFVPVEKLAAACGLLRALCADYAPFDITLDGYGTFPQIAFMKIVNPEPIKALFRRVRALFPEYLPYEGQYGDDLHPHVTVAQFPDEAAQQAVHLPAYAPITFRADRLHVAYGELTSDMPWWVTYDVIPFGKV
jgi:2'-5' RNA ligase